MALRVRKSRAAPAPPHCPLSECLKLIGGVWTPNLIWHLRGGARRFGELRVDIPKISAKVLSARLRRLEADHLVLRQVLPTSPPSVEYSLTPLGEELLPAIDAIVRVGEKLKRLPR
jgi:DNA-binding HxlR family transcriptional regulator